MIAKLEAGVEPPTQELDALRIDGAVGRRSTCPR